MTKNIDAWQLSRYTTNHLRDAANDLREHISGFVLDDGTSSPKDSTVMEAVKALAIAADYIDRLKQDVAPVIVHTSVGATASGDIYLFGTDTTGQLWQYSFGNGGGWMPMKGAVSVAEAVQTPEVSDTH